MHLFWIFEQFQNSKLWCTNYYWVCGYRDERFRLCDVLKLGIVCFLNSYIRCHLMVNV